MEKIYFLRKMIFAGLLICIGFSFTVNTTYAETWTKIDSTNYHVNDIYLPPDNPAQVILSSGYGQTDYLARTVTFVITGSDGYRLSNDSGKTFGAAIMPSFQFYKIIKLPENPSYWIASVKNFQNGGIMISSNAGTNWDTINLHCVSTNEQVLDLKAKRGNPDLLIGAAVGSSHGFKYSTDTFTTCQSIDTMLVSSRSIEISPIDSTLIFLAGDAQYSGGVFRSTDNGKTWQQSSIGLENKRVLCVMPSSNNKAVVYCGVDTLSDLGELISGKGIYQSLDTGKTWHLVGAAGARPVQIARHPLNPRYYAAACDSMGVWVSGSDGYGWESFNNGLPANSQVWRIAIPAWEPNQAGAFVFAGIKSQGLYKSSRLVTGIEDNPATDNSLDIINIYPQPFSGNVNISWHNPSEQNVEISVRDVFGRLIFNDGNNIYTQGLNMFTWTPESSVSPGVYFVAIKAGNITKAEKVIYNK